MLNDKTVTDKTEDEKNIGEKAAAQEVKLCTRCGRTLPISSFFTRKYESGKVVPRSECKECTNAINKKNEYEVIATSSEQAEEISRRRFDHTPNFTVNDVEVEFKENWR